MRKLSYILVFGFLMLSAGCIRSLHPMYTEKDIVFESSLIGQWAEDESAEVWDFSKEGTDKYRLVYTDDTGKLGTFDAHLLKIEGFLFIDVFPTKPDLKENDFYQSHLLSVHTFVYVKQIEPTLQLSFPNPDWLKDLLKEDPGAIEHEMINSEIVLSAPTEKLQAFWLKHLDKEGAFDDFSNMKRQ